LRAFADSETLLRLDEALEERGYRTHEFGDSIFLPRSTRAGPQETCGRSWTAGHAVA
jgi:hypothetical protein